MNRPINQYGECTHAHHPKKKMPVYINHEYPCSLYSLRGEESMARLIIINIAGIIHRYGITHEIFTMLTVTLVS